MKTMLWKELRENGKWALLAFLVLTVAEFYTLSSSGDADAYNQNGLTVCSSSFLLVTSFGCAAIGAALGIVQILPELNRDRWAALLHRPVSRDVIFLGKSIAGLLLYFLAVTLPFLASVIYTAIPGQFAVPLVPGMLIPAASDLFLGPVFYFTAILLCLHRGRWFGSRGLIGLSVVPVFLLHLILDWPFLLPLLATLVYFIAARGVMRGNGSIPPRAWGARAAVVLALMTGVETLLVILIFFLQMVPAMNSIISGTYTQFEITRDGQVFLSTGKGDGSDTVTKDMNGKVVTDERYVGNDTYQNFIQLLPFAYHPQADSAVDTTSRELSTYLRSLDLNRGQGGSENWFLLVAQNYFIGYDKLSKRCIGICDAGGFEPAGAIPRPFPEPLSTYDFWTRVDPALYWSGSQLYALSFSERQMKALYKAPGDTFFGAMNLFDQTKHDKPSRVAVTLSNDIRMLDPDGHVILNIPYGHDPANWPDVSLATSPDQSRTYLQYTPAYRFDLPPDSRPSLPSYLDEIDAQGKLVHSYSCSSPSFNFSSGSWLDSLSTFASPLLPSLLELGLQSHVPLRVVIFYSLASSLNASMQSIPRQLLSLTAIALVLAAITLFWARRAGFSPRRAGLWALFVFGFGLPGLIAFRFASNWPTRVRCPQCQARRPIETEDCPSCHKPWPAPAPTGIEIFEPRDVRI